MYLEIASGKLSWIEVYRLCIGFVTPRPIALVSTIGADGRRNLAPYSFYNMVCAKPPTVIVSCGKNRHGRDKDTFLNIQETQEFVVATVTAQIAEPMVRCGAELPHGESEFEFSGFTGAPGRLVKPWLVRESPVNLECRLNRVVSLGDGSSNVVFGEVVAIHVDDALLDREGHVDPHLLTTVGRLGGAWYANADGPYALEIPKPPAAR
jgi:flavin reductase (DIM6/NTAB) family NADH-FMN oxidoreductase RutF